jgi:hypothetical protein
LSESETHRGVSRQRSMGFAALNPSYAPQSILRRAAASDH